MKYVPNLYVLRKLSQPFRIANPFEWMMAIGGALTLGSGWMLIIDLLRVSS